MTRLPDEAPGISERTVTPSPTSSLESSRPGSSGSNRKQGGLLTLPIESVSTHVPMAAGYSANSPVRNQKKTAPTTPTNAMQRLPDEPSELEKPPEAKQEAAPVGNKMSAMRERLRPIKTPAVKPPEPLTKKIDKIFRTLKAGESINDTYNFEEEIYSGGCKGRVLVARRKVDGAEVVVKIRAKQNNRMTERNWRTIMAQMHGISTNRDSNATHWFPQRDHVLGFSEIVEGENEFFVVMPKCNGGELFEFLANETEVPEAECKRIIREILTAVGHLHANNIIHRDIKPENIMFDMDLHLESSPKTVKLID